MIFYFEVDTLFLHTGFLKLLSKINKKLGKKFSKLFGMGKRSAGVELLTGLDENVDQVNQFYIMVIKTVLF